jgi:hypothetical protein
MRALLVGAWAALFSLITTTLSLMADWHPTGQTAVLYRAGVTLLQTFLASMATSAFTSFADAGALGALATALGTAFLAALKSLVGLANPATLGDSTAVPAVDVSTTYDEQANTGAAYRFPNPDDGITLK